MALQRAGKAVVVKQLLALTMPHTAPCCKLPGTMTWGPLPSSLRKAPQGCTQCRGQRASCRQCRTNSTGLENEQAVR